MINIIKESVYGVETDTIHAYDTCDNPIDSIDSIDSIDIIFVPGNPGTLEFYVDFLNSFRIMVKELSHAQFSVNLHAAGHANHHLEDFSHMLSNRDNYSKYGLDFQIMHLISFIEGVIAGNKRKIMFIGHSIGCYMILEAIRSHRRIRDATMEIIQLMPFLLWKNISSNHKYILNAYVRTLPFSARMVGSIGYRYVCLPTTFKRTLTRLFTNLMEPYLSILSHNLFSMRLIENFFEMGKDEILYVPRDEESMLELLINLDKDHVSICTIYTEFDVWAPIEDINILQSALGRNREHVMHCHGVSHGFTLDVRGSEKMLGALSTYLSKRQLRKC